MSTALELSAQDSIPNKTKQHIDGRFPSPWAEIASASIDRVQQRPVYLQAHRLAEHFNLQHQPIRADAIFNESLQPGHRPRPHFDAYTAL
jgi:hypothetical protein